MADLPLYLVEVRKVEHQHYRWFCTCGSKGIRLIYRQNVQALADKHYQQKHMPKPPTKDQRIAALQDGRLWRIGIFMCTRPSCLLSRGGQYVEHRTKKAKR